MAAPRGPSAAIFGRVTRGHIVRAPTIFNTCAAESSMCSRRIRHVFPPYSARPSAGFETSSRRIHLVTIPELSTLPSADARPSLAVSVHRAPGYFPPLRRRCFSESTPLHHRLRRDRPHRIRRLSRIRLERGRGTAASLHDPCRIRQPHNARAPRSARIRWQRHAARRG